MLGFEVRQSRDQPPDGQRRIQLQGEDVTPARRDQPLGRIGNAIEGFPHTGIQRTTRRREAERARLAVEQGKPEMLFQLFDVVTDRGV